MELVQFSESVENALVQILRASLVRVVHVEHGHLIEEESTAQL